MTAPRRPGPRRRSALGAMLAAGLAGALVGCTGTGAPILANAPLVLPVPATPSPTAAPPADPRPIVLPRDDGPHDRLTEWWYYTGHLAAIGGQRFGFEAVIFRAERGSVPTSWAAHLALTDESGKRFLFAQRSEIGPQVDRSPRGTDGTPTGFDLGVAGFDPAIPAAAPGVPWRLAGSDGHDRIEAALTATESATAGGAFGLALGLSASRGPALHDEDGWIDFGPAGGSYYYSRTRMDAAGSVTLDGTTYAVTGLGWFDHQWGDFISVGGGGWDWFAVNLDDGRDLTLSLVRAPDGTYPIVYGTLVETDGTVRHLDAADFNVRPTGSWTSPRTGATYPAGWRLEVLDPSIALDIAPTVADQELDTRPTTGVVYWEGSQRVTRAGTNEVIGQAYVELTGYPTAR